MYSWRAAAESYASFSPSAYFGIADGGHTNDVVRRIREKFDELKQREGWSEPFVRVHFMASEHAFGDEIELEQVVEALNTSLQVKQYTLDEYTREFEDLKEALERQGFPPQRHRLPGE